MKLILMKMFRLVSDCPSVFVFKMFQEAALLHGEKDSLREHPAIFKVNSRLTH